jgi:DNA-3-methyladenine glycosylase I
VEGLHRGTDGVVRCWWPGEDPAYLDYHDTEWGVPVHDDRRLFEKLCLEGFQAGLSWLTILRKRPAFREVFLDFDPIRVASFGDDDVVRLLADARIVRHRGKIEATVANARAMLGMLDEVGSLAGHVWAFAPPPGPRPVTPADVPTSSPEAVALSKDLKRRGWRFVGPTTVYAFMQSMGLVDDHLAGCDIVT